MLSQWTKDDESLLIPISVIIQLSPQDQTFQVHSMAIYEETVYFAYSYLTKLTK